MVISIIQKAKKDIQMIFTTYYMDRLANEYVLQNGKVFLKQNINDSYYMDCWENTINLSFISLLKKYLKYKKYGWI